MNLFITHVNQVKNQYNLFHIYGLFFLVFICFFGSTNQAIYYLLYDARNVNIIFYWRFIFIIFCILHTFIPQLGDNFLNIIFQCKILNYSVKKIEKLYHWVTSHSVISLIIFEIYVGLFFLHVLMILLNNIDYHIEFFYQIFVLLKNLFIMVPVISLYISKYLFVPLHSQSSPINAEEINQLIDLSKKVATALKKTAASNPKITGGVVLAGTAISSIYGYGLTQQNQMGASAAGSGINTEGLLKNPDIFVDGDNKKKAPLIDLFAQLVRLQILKEKSPFDIGVEDIKRLFTEQPSVAREFNDVVTVFSEELLKNAIENYLLQKNNNIPDELMGSPASKPLLSQNKELDPDLSMGSQVVPKSPLEYFLDIFY